MALVSPRRTLQRINVYSGSFGLDISAFSRKGDLSCESLLALS